MTACRYHSLIVEQATLPSCLEISARTEQGEIMGLRHRELPVVGVQFHPESILTDQGYDLLANFLCIAGLPIVEPRPNITTERSIPQRQQTQPGSPVTF
jgi:GMP synthase-like glutamine amidotransferase